MKLTPSTNTINVAIARFKLTLEEAEKYAQPIANSKLQVCKHVKFCLENPKHAKTCQESGKSALKEVSFVDFFKDITSSDWGEFQLKCSTEILKK